MKLIDKDALASEIERRMNLRDSNYKKNHCMGDFIVFEELEYLHDEFLPTLEVKEVDLEKEIEEYLSIYWSNEKDLHPFLGHMAKHFFELGMQFQTDTNITLKYNIGESVKEYKAQKGIN